jgi:hypothetical protein
LLGGADIDTVSVMPADLAISMIDVGPGRRTIIGCTRNQSARTCLAWVAKRRTLLSPETPWREKPRGIEHNEIVNRVRGETDSFEGMTPISRAPYAFVRSTTLEMAPEAMRVNPFYHLII